MATKIGRSQKTVWAPGGPPVVFGMINLAYQAKGAAGGSLDDDTLKNPSADFSEVNLADGIEIEDVFNQFYDGEKPETRRVDFEEVYENHEENVKALKDQLDYLKENGTPEQVADFAFALANSEEYQNMVFTKEQGRKLRVVHGDNAAELNRKLTKLIEDGKGEEFSDEEAEEMYQEYQKALGYEDDFKGTGALLEDYKNIVTDALNYSYSNRDTSDVIGEFTGEKMGEMYMFADTEPGSREWHEARQTGFGGSDMGAIGAEYEKKFDADGNEIQVFDKKDNLLPGEKNGHYEDGLEEIWKSKLNPIEEDQILDQSVDNFDGADAAIRGHGQEEIIGELAARREGLKLLHNKGTWTRDGSSININYDFMLSSDGITPDGNFEIKTASDPTKWGAEELGIDGIPTEYRAQVLAGCYEAGFKRGGLAVLINERDLKVYQFEMTPELEQEAKLNKERADKAYEAVEEARKTGDKEFKREVFGLTPKRARAKSVGYAKAMLTKGLAGDKGRLFRRIASMRGTSFESVKQEFVDSLPAKTGDWKPPVVKKGLDRLYAKTGGHIMSRGVARGADIEATDLSSSRGRIIEIGVTSVDMNTGEFKNSYSELFDVPPAHRYGKGTGSEDVHNISVKDIEGKRRIDDESIHQEILDHFKKDGGVIYAHNISYERQFLRGNVKGFAAAEARGEIRFVDTMDITKHTMPDTNSNKLEDFVTHNGGQYLNAHRALQDTQMMMSALRNYFGGMFGGNKEIRDLA